MWSVSVGVDPVRRLSVLVLAVFLSQLAGCAGSGKQARSPEALQRRYPLDRYMTAFGSSEESVAAAGLDARAQIAMQIDSSLRASSQSSLRSSLRNGRIVDTQDLASSVDVVTSFEENEFIHTLELAPDRDGDHRIFAFLDRRELAAHYRSCFNAALLEQGPRVERMAAEDPAADGFPLHWLEACRAQRELLRYARYHEVLMSSRLPGQDELADLGRTMTATRARALADVRVAVNADPVEGIQPALLEAKILSAFTSLGVATTATAARPGDWTLRVRPELIKTRLIGEIHRITMEAELIPYSEHRIRSTLHLDDSAFTGEGAHPTRDALDAMTVPRVATLLVRTLSHVFPLDSP